MIILIWIAQQIAHIIKSIKYFIIIYIDYKTNSTIIAKTKSNTININKFNLRLIKISIYCGEVAVWNREKGDNGKKKEKKRKKRWKWG